jgi:hypothetical protein
MVVIASIIVERPTCLACIADKTGGAQLDAVRALERIGKTIHVAIENNERCRVCGSTLGPVYSLDRG